MKSIWIALGVLIAGGSCLQGAVMARAEPAAPVAAPVPAASAAAAAASDTESTAESAAGNVRRSARNSPNKGKASREKEADGTEALDRFQADTAIKSQYQLDGQSLEADPD